MSKMFGSSWLPLFLIPMVIYMDKIRPIGQYLKVALKCTFLFYVTIGQYREITGQIVLEQNSHPYVSDLRENQAIGFS